MKQLSELLRLTTYKSVTGNMDVSIFDLTADSREVKTGSLFICLVGAHVDAHDFAQAAVEKGASVIVAQREISVPSSVTVVYVEDTRRAMEDMAPAFFDYPSRKMRMIAVTGTNGKTTFTHIMSHILETSGYKTGVIGTIHTLIGHKEFASHNTTPDVVDLERTLARMVDAGVEYCCMEVSSHALVMGRVAGVEFDNASFTNLTEDHLDFHKTMDNYAKAKALLFQSVTGAGQTKAHKSCHINADADYADVMLSACDKSHADVMTYSIEKPSDLRATEIAFNASSSDFIVETKDGKYPVHTNLVGRFNVYNVLTAISASLSEGIPMEKILSALRDFRAVPGRFELIDEGQNFTVVVDYAHTPDGLENILKTAREICHGNIITVFGCGGDRDALKRPIMGRIAAKYSDTVIVTSDNPRTENPASIVAEVAAGVEKIVDTGAHISHEIIVSRHEAIARAIAIAEAGDMVVIAGKGHEDYQILADRTIHFDDREEARAAIRGKCHG